VKEAGAPDRVWYTFGLKLQVVQYESVDFSIGHASDVRLNETAEQALIRIASLVHDAAGQQAAQIRGMDRTGAPEPERRKKKR
jgi:hypothetical protein